MPLTSDSEIARLLQETRTIALVGASDRPDRAAYEVMQFLQQAGYRVLPVNPVLAGQVIHGETVRAALADIAEPIDMVDVFRRSAFVAGVVDEAIAVRAKAVWTQLGVIDTAAAAHAEAAGLRVVMDRCPKIELRRLGLTRQDG
jgi:predicted CoA-binding protein